MTSLPKRSLVPRTRIALLTASVALVAVVVYLIVVLLTLLGRALPVPASAVADVVGDSRVVISTETTTNGSSPVELQRLVLDLDTSTSKGAVQKKVDHLVSQGWRKVSRDETGVDLVSNEHDVTASVEGLPSFLDRTEGDSIFYDDLLSKIRDKVAQPQGLIIVKMQAQRT